MGNELDLILLEQLTQAKRNRRLALKMRLLLKADPHLDAGMAFIDGRIAFLEGMISDKTLLSKKRKRPREKDPDILSRNPFFEAYRQAAFVTFFSYKICADSLSNYVSLFRRDKG